MCSHRYSNPSGPVNTRDLINIGQVSRKERSESFKQSHLPFNPQNFFLKKSCAAISLLPNRRTDGTILWNCTSPIGTSWSWTTRLILAVLDDSARGHSTLYSACECSFLKVELNGDVSERYRCMLICLFPVVFTANCKTIDVFHETTNKAPPTICRQY